MREFDVATLTSPARATRFGSRSATGCDDFDYAPDQPNLFMLMNFKHFLVEQHGIQSGFDLYRQAVTSPRGAALRPLKLQSHHAYCASRAKTFREIFPAGEPIAVAAPRVIGAGNHRTLANETRSFYVACIEDACVRGRSSVIETDGQALADFQADELIRIDDELEFDSAVFHRDDSRLWTIVADHPIRNMETAFTLLGCRTDFFGDWLTESISKYVGATLKGDLPAVPILIDAAMPKTHREALDLMLADDVEIVEIPAFESVRVERLWSASGIGYMAFHQKHTERFKWDYFVTSPERSLDVEREMGRRADLRLGERDWPTRVFLARKDFRHRKLINRAEIEAIAAEAGFAIVYTEDLKFADQVGLLRNARFVIGPEGSAFFLSIFLESGARMCVLNHQETEGLVLYNSGCDLKDIDLTIITGPQSGPVRGSPQDVNYSIDSDVFRQFLAGWLTS